MILTRLIVSVVVCAYCMDAQEPFGSIRGRTLDVTGSAIAGVAVKAVAQGTGVTTDTVTGREGEFSIGYLAPGTYSLTASTTGFKTAVRSSIEIRVGETVNLDFELAVGDAAEKMTVSETPELLESDTASIGQLADQKRITDLPLPGGNAFSLARVTAGVVNLSVSNHPTLAPAVEVVSQLSVDGTRSGNTEFSIDGSPSMWQQNASFVPPVDTVAQFKVQTATYDASQSHAAGGNVNVALRSGTNQFHGALFEAHTDTKLEAMDLFQRQFLYNPSTGPVTKDKLSLANPPTILNHFGATLGGPVILPRIFNGRNKTFFLYGFEGLTRPSTERGNYIYSVPTLAERMGDLSSLLKLGPSYQIYDPATTVPAANGRFARQPFADNIIPASRLNPTALKLLNLYPVSNVAGNADSSNNYFHPSPSYNEYFSHLARVDQNFSEKNRLFGRYQQFYNLFVSGQNLATGANQNNRYRYSKGIGLDDIYVFSPQFVMNVRYGWSRFIQRFTPQEAGFDLAGSGFSTSLTAQIAPGAVTLPQINVDGLVQLGSSYASGNFTNYHTWAAEFTSLRGPHSVRFGAEFRLYRETDNSVTYATPRLDFSSTYTNGPLDNAAAAPIGPGLASFLLGIPTGGRLDTNASLAEQSTSTGLYLQDDLKVNARLTLNLGVRYDFETAPTELHNRTVRGFDFNAVSPVEAVALANYSANPIPDVSLAQFAVKGGIQFAGSGGQPRALWNAPRTNFAPRVGLAFRLDRQTVLRSGYGVFYVPLTIDRLSVIQSGFSTSTTLVPTTDSGQHFIATLANPFPNGHQLPSGADLGLATNLGQAVTFFNPHPKNGYQQRWSFSLQRQIGSAAVVEISYVGNRGTRLPITRELDAVPNQYLSTSTVRDPAVINHLTQQVANPFYPALPGTGLSARTVPLNQLLRKFPQFTSIQEDQPVGYSWYHSMQATAEQRFTHGFTVRGNYTWSKYMEANSYLNAGDAQPAKTISDLDRTHRVTGTGVWELPVGPGRALLTGAHGVFASLVGGWQVNAVWQWNTGAPLSFGNVLYYADLPSIASGNQTLGQWFQVNSFERNPANQLANNLRTFPLRVSGTRAPATNNWDISGFKTFKVRELFSLQFKSEWLNALNHSGLSAPNTIPTSGSFGQVTSTNGFPRQIQFALKLIY